MTLPIRFVPLAVATACLLALAGCGGSDDGAPASPAFSGFNGGAVSLQFAAQAGNLPVLCGSTLLDIGTGKVSARLQDLRVHIANVRFVKADGSEVPLALTLKPAADEFWNAANGTDSLTLIDLEDGTAECTGGTAATNAVITGTVAAGEYVAVKMTLGVPESMNHLDMFGVSTPLALSSTSLGWNWTTGRIFSKIEVTDPARATAPSWPAPVFTSHVGALNCTGDPAAGVPANCAIPNRMEFTLGSSATNFDPTKQKVVIDVQALLAGNDVTQNTAGTASGCMSALDDPECAAIFEVMKIERASGLPINGGAGQTLFRAAAL